MSNHHPVDVIIIGAGAAGLMCAIRAAERGLSVLVLEKNSYPGNKIKISGGGRCNFTNLHTSPTAYLSDNPHFCKSASARYTPWHFIELMGRYGLTYHEKTLGQLFCDQKSQAIIDMLVQEATTHGAQLVYEIAINEVNPSQAGAGYQLQTNQGDFYAHQLVIATGGPSIPKIGGDAFALRLAKQFGIANQPFSPALVPLTLSSKMLATTAALAGVSHRAMVSFEQQSFLENLLFTHRGLSGPAILQISSYWQKSQPIYVDFSPELPLQSHLLACKMQSPNKTLKQVLAAILPKKLNQVLLQQIESQYCNNHTQKLKDTKDIKGTKDSTPHSELVLQQLTHTQLTTIANQLHQWAFYPTGSEGMKKAEVSLGGVLTDELSSKTFACHKRPDLYFIGEAVNVTGWLGGYNFQWAWASGWCCGDALMAY